MDNERLIKHVRSYVELYDLCHPKYMNVGHKDLIWQRIGEAMHQSGPACKARWNNIRDQYRRNMKKRKTRNGDSSRKIRKYKYEDLLTFLNDHFQERDPNGDIPSEPFYPKEETLHKIEKNQTYDEDSITPDTLCNQIYTSDENILHSLNLMPKFKNEPHEPAISTSVDHSEKNGVHTGGHGQQHPADAFLLGIASTLKTFSPFYQNLAKSKIFYAVQEIELKIIMEKEKIEKNG